MQENINILESTTSLEKKSIAVKNLEKFKSNIITFLDEPQTEILININPNNVIDVIEEIKSKLEVYEINTIDDVRELLILKIRLQKCISIINDLKPKIELVDGLTSTDVTGKIKKKFALATTVNDQCFNWNTINKNFNNNSMSKILKSKIKQNLAPIKIKLSCFRALSNFTILKQISGHNIILIGSNELTMYCKVLVNEDGFAYMFYQNEDQFVCVYYEYSDKTYLCVECNDGYNRVIDEEGFLVDVDDKNVIENICNSILQKFIN